MASVLVVDDELFLASAYRAKLVGRGFEVRIAHEGETALRMLAEQVPDVLMLDLIMPVMDGFMTLEAIRAQPALANLPVIVVTNLSQQEDYDKAEQLGADAFIVKSEASLDEVVAVVERYAQSSQKT